MPCDIEILDNIGLGNGLSHTVKWRSNAVFGVQEIDRVIAVTAL